MNLLLLLSDYSIVGKDGEFSDTGLPLNTQPVSFHTEAQWRNIRPSLKDMSEKAYSLDIKGVDGWNDAHDCQDKQLTLSLVPTTDVLKWLYFKMEF